MEAPPSSTGKYIVRFHDYKMQDVHKRAVQEALEPLHGQGYKWLRRKNRAAKHPTDFGLLQIHPGHEGHVKVPMPPLVMPGYTFKRHPRSKLRPPPPPP